MLDYNDIIGMYYAERIPEEQGRWSKQRSMMETAQKGTGSGRTESRGGGEGAERWWSPRGMQWGAPKSFQEEPTPGHLVPVLTSRLS